MKQPLIIGNWKSNKTPEEVKKWFAEIASASFPSTQAQVVLCPPFPLLSLCKELLQHYRLPWQLGAQDVSSQDIGKHTGEVSATLLKDYCTHVLIGHSERRIELRETDAMLFEKVKRAHDAGLKPIFFVQGEETPIPERIDILAYEPIFAIGSGHPDSPEHAEKVAHYFKTVRHIPTVLYGGSVTEKNIALFLSLASLDGVVPGTASLDALTFGKLVTYA